ncbi:hypothetical protein [Falsibacillus pallidus]|uniref:Uncharacterized protein n=1 Tax=Falsibacillus pallidus TaxID=493781 RepID=A0A370GV79_9BACI|nr:hypothetical protein [Falsibacillus pallidus]RDI47578.1 hypothetical protein DFR59_101237 [Falsibacillus pallidus]
MDVQLIWDKFIEKLNSYEIILNAEWRKIAGIPFIYVQSNAPSSEMENAIKRASGFAMRGKQLNCETIYVRSEQNLHVYRHRFYVPQQKMFCCGNMCEDCIRLRPNPFWE